jgi:hypothetical protein
MTEQPVEHFARAKVPRPEVSSAVARWAATSRSSRSIQLTHLPPLLPPALARLDEPRSPDRDDKRRSIEVVRVADLSTASQLTANDTCAEQEDGDHRAPNVEAPFVLGRAKESHGIGRQQILRPSVWLTELVDEATKDRPLVIDSGDTQITADSVKEQAVSNVQTRIRIPPAVGLLRSQRRGHW